MIIDSNRFERSSAMPGSNNRSIPFEDQVVSQGQRLVKRPRLEAEYKLRLVDDTVVQREQTEEGVTVGTHVELRR